MARTKKTAPKFTSANIPAGGIVRLEGAAWTCGECHTLNWYGFRCCSQPTAPTATEETW